MDSDAVVAQGDGADNRFTGQRTAATPEAIVQTLHPQDRPIAAGPFRVGRSSCRETASQLVIARWRRSFLRLQTDLLPQPIDHLMQGDRAEPQGRQEVVGGRHIATLGHADHGVAVQQGIEPDASQLPLQQILAAQDRVIAMAAIVQLTNAVARRGR